MCTQKMAKKSKTPKVLNPIAEADGSTVKLANSQNHRPAAEMEEPRRRDILPPDAYAGSNFPAPERG